MDTQLNRYCRIGLIALFVLAVCFCANGVALAAESPSPEYPPTVQEPTPTPVMVDRSTIMVNGKPVPYSQTTRDYRIRLDKLKSQTLTVSGKTTPGYEIKVVIDPQSTGFSSTENPVNIEASPTTADQNGEWTVEIDASPLLKGDSHSLYVTYAVAGDTGEKSYNHITDRIAYLEKKGGFSGLTLLLIIVAIVVVYKVVALKKKPVV